MKDGYQQIGNYIYSHPLKRVGRYIVGIADAYNAFGLIGPEHNGVFVLDDEDKCVVCDQIDKQSSGYFGPSDTQKIMLETLSKRSEEKLLEFCRTHGRYRG